jgi:uncharacterized protein
LLQGRYDCIFLQQSDNRRVCSVYPVRPLQCRTWPFWEGLLATPDNWASASQTCPGINTGPTHSRSSIESLRDAEDWPA